MQNKTQLVAQSELVTTLKVLAHAYEEVSIIRMQKVRDNVINTRKFLLTLSEIFADVKESYKKEIMEIMQKKNKQNKNFVFSSHAKNGKTAYVFMSSNARLYGDIVKKVFNLFMENVEKDPNSEIVIVGRVGRDLFSLQQKVKRPYTFFEIPDVNVKLEDLKPVVAFMLPFETVNVFYGQFNNLVTQSATAASVTGDQPLSNETHIDQKIEFYFEPSLETVLNFFEHQVFGSLFKQTVHEGELARLASRVKAMEAALVNIEKEEGSLHSQSRRLRKLIDNKKRIESLAGVALWS